jgi:hypothetical protein
VSSGAFQVEKTSAVDEEESAPEGDEKDGREGSRTATYVAVPVVLLVLGLGVFCANRRWNLLKCGEYKVISDISETEL